MKVKLIGQNYKDNYVENLLHERGIDDVDSFLSPRWNNLQDWRDLENIQKGLDLVYLPTGARVGLIVDCDVDGFSSAAIIYQYLKQFMSHIEIKYYIHSGKAHGLEEHWEEIRDENFNLVIVPDAGRLTA